MVIGRIQGFRSHDGIGWDKDSKINIKRATVSMREACILQIQ